VRRSFALLALCLLAPGVSRAEEVIPRRALEALASEWFQARPATAFGTFEPARRAALLERAEALGEMPEGALDDVVEIFWKAVRKHGPRGRGSIETPYGEATWIQKGRGGPKEGLVLGLHGGGVGAGSASEAAGKWMLPRHLGMCPQAIRLIHDAWNSVHGERFLLTLIEIAKAQYEVDPDRVYAMGFSMGGSGSMFLAGRHPDLVAGAVPAHGVVAARGGTKVVEEKEVGELEHGLLPNLRNTAVYFSTGEKDRNCEPGTFKKAWTAIQALRAADESGYRDLRFLLSPDTAHTFEPGEPQAAIEWVTAMRRDPHPTRIVWEYNADPWPFPDAEDQDKAKRLPKRWMYWIHCAAPRDRMRVTAHLRREAEATVIDLSVTEIFPEELTLYLVPGLVDPSKEVVVQVDGKERWRGRPKPTYAAVLESLDARLDRRLVFDRRIPVPE